MFSITTSSAAPDKLQLLRKWLVAEWGEIDPFEGTIEGVDVPLPLLALENENLVGGLSFTSAMTPGSEKIGLWINTLLVALECRGKGIATQLVKQASIEALRTNASVLYVYTAVPALYQKLGWEIVNSSGGNTVLKMVLVNSK
jgi:GNAT superfamily N-acetyltransferase